MKRIEFCQYSTTKIINAIGYVWFHQIHGTIYSIRGAKVQKDSVSVAISSKKQKYFSSIYLSLIYIHAFSVAAICPGTPAEPPGRGTICKTGTTICNLSISHAPYPHYLCHRTLHGVHDTQDKERQHGIEGSTERFYASPAREKFGQKSVFPGPMLLEIENLCVFS